VATVAEFLASLGGGLRALSGLSSGEIESFVVVTGKRMSRESLQHVIGHLRSLLRYLASRGKAPAGLDRQIDTPRVYRGERLPRALPWETVQRLLGSIDRTTPLGLRDYAMLTLIATYGLRTCEVVALRLQDIEWKAARLNVPTRKTLTALLLPLTDGVGDSLVEYLRRGRPDVPYREVFVRHRAPSGILKPTAVTEAFQCWSRRSQLGIPFQGPHCLRHSYAVHLLRKGVSLKTIGDLLGHRYAESTCVYLRLAVDDLREVALSLPSRQREVAP
jgi:site-specific recombinase XerD